MLLFYLLQFLALVLWSNSNCCIVKSHHVTKMWEILYFPAMLSWILVCYFNFASFLQKHFFIRSDERFAQINLRHYSLNCHSCLHIGHSCWWSWELSHLRMQCIWNTCEQRPQTKGQSSPGILQSGQQPSKAIRQMPQFSSLATQRHVATPIHLL